MYDESVPILQRYLTQLDEMLLKTQHHLTQDEADLLCIRLTPDMLPFYRQVLIAIGFALRATAPLVNLETPQLKHHEKNLSQLHQDIEYAQKFLTDLTPEQFMNSNTRTIEHQAGQAQHKMTGAVYLHQYALPNFFFHLMCVYLTLRQQGVPLGKHDFDGFHQY